MDLREIRGKFQGAAMVAARMFRHVRGVRWMPADH
jgi:hypothetical protein